MLGKTHRIAGALTGLALAGFMFKNDSHLVNTGAIVLGSIWGSGFPDTDTAASISGRSSIIGNAIYNALASAASEFNQVHKHDVIGHRGITHSVLVFLPLSLLSALIWGVFSFIGPASTLFLYFILGISIGILSHIFLDCCNTNGVKLFAPVSDRSFSLMQIKVGGIFEKIISIIFGILLFFNVVQLINKIFG